ncbi:putative membrane protein [Campylobacter iguaniorum]|uniref:acyltransferase family protein n=1 Tax=Campylobacter iguaniorum TaxID=1244531 RepID=UPI00073A0304|nr:acyltransferase [Campylobacter iguaniorum]ALV23677.1 putative membrane protein [Campylobacter iguaniorum]
MKENNFDLLRLIAAFQVMTMHSVSHILSEHNYVLDNGGGYIISMLAYIPGVPIFFLISGFLITMSYEKNQNLKDYVRNRILRIFPGLYVNILIGVVILLYFGFVEFSYQFFSWLLAQLTIVQFYNAEMFRGFGVGVINGSLWTISVELTFYIILPFLYFIFYRSKILFVFLAVVSFIVWNYDINSSKELFLNKLIHVSIIPYVFLFILGICFYKFFNKIQRLIENKFLIWLLLFIVFNILVKIANIENNLYIYTIKWIIFSFMVFAFVFSFKNLSKKILHGNDYTFGIYIYHMLVINVFIYLNYVAEIKFIMAVFILSILCGIISWHIIEKPFLRLKTHSIFNERNK